MVLLLEAEQCRFQCERSAILDKNTHGIVMWMSHTDAHVVELEHVRGVMTGVGSFDWITSKPTASMAQKIV